VARVLTIPTVAAAFWLIHPAGHVMSLASTRRRSVATS
jgi:hypothetical protein